MSAAGEIGLLLKSMAHGTQQAIGSVIGKSTSKVWGYQLEEFVSPGRAPSFRNDTWCRLRAHGTDGTVDRILKRNDKGVSNKNKTHQLRVVVEHQSIEQKFAVEKARNCASARSQTCRRARERPRARARQFCADTSSARRDRRRTGADGPSSTQRLQVASCKMFVLQSRSCRCHIHRERVFSKDVKLHAAELCHVDEANQRFETRETMRQIFSYG